MLCSNPTTDMYSSVKIIDYFLPSATRFPMWMCVELIEHHPVWLKMVKNFLYYSINFSPPLISWYPIISALCSHTSSSSSRGKMILNVSKTVFFSWNRSFQEEEKNNTPGWMHFQTAWLIFSLCLALNGFISCF